METKFDSAISTNEHILLVQKNMRTFIDQLQERLVKHDSSKLVNPEKKILDEQLQLVIEAEKAHGFGSDEYMAAVDGMGDYNALHFAANDHHPEYFPYQIKDMNLFQVVEMFCDWMAANQRSGLRFAHTLGVVRAKYDIEDETMLLLTNTAEALELITDTEVENLFCAYWNVVPVDENGEPIADEK